MMNITVSRLVAGPTRARIGVKASNRLNSATTSPSRSLSQAARAYTSKARKVSSISSKYNTTSKIRELSLSVPSYATGSFSRSITRPHAVQNGHRTRRTIFIRTESTPNPDSMKFMPDKQLLEPGQSIDFENAMVAARSPLAKMLFRNDCVQRVFIGSTFVTVTKDEEMEWDQVKPLIFADLMEFLTTGEPVLLGEAPVSDTTILPTDSEDVALIKTLIETRIRPSIQDDGGDLTFKGFIDGVVFLQLQGSCTSCPSSSVTLKSGIEKMLKHWSSSVVGVVAVENEEEWERIASGQPQIASDSNATDAPKAPKTENTQTTKDSGMREADLSANAARARSSASDDL